MPEKKESASPKGYFLEKSEDAHMFENPEAIYLSKLCAMLIYQNARKISYFLLTRVLPFLLSYFKLYFSRIVVAVRFRSVLL